MRERSFASTRERASTLDEPNPRSTTRLGRVVRREPTAVLVQCPDGAVIERSLDDSALPTQLQVGDLVDVSIHTVRHVRTNVSTTPIEKQDWWRLLQIAPNLHARHRLRRAVREYFDADGFLELEPPALSNRSSLEVHLQSLPVQVGDTTHYLQTSPEYHLKRALSAGFSRIYSLGRAFRGDESGQHHHTEFTMLEWYRALQPIDTLMQDVEALVELATGQPRAWTHLTVAEALAEFSVPTDVPDEIVARLVQDVEPRLKELGAVFLTEYPASLASLATLHPERPEVSLRFEAYVDGLELANGFGELICPIEQRERFLRDQMTRDELGLPVHAIDERFIDALAAGLAPTSGIALGFDRLLMLGTQTRHIDDVTLFPPELA